MESGLLGLRQIDMIDLPDIGEQVIAGIEYAVEFFPNDAGTVRYNTNEVARRLGEIQDLHIILPIFSEPSEYFAQLYDLLIQRSHDTSTFFVFIVSRDTEIGFQQQLGNWSEYIGNVLILFMKDK